MRDINQFDLTLYNISDTRIKPDAVERLPSESETRNIKVPMSRKALEAYSKNLYANKFGDCLIRHTRAGFGGGWPPSGVKA